MAMRRRAALTLVEVVLASLILLIAVPTFVQTALTISRVDEARESRAMAMGLAQSAVERLRFEAYNGDSRGYRLTDDSPARAAQYTTASSWLRYAGPLDAAEDWIVPSPARPGGTQSLVMTRFFEEHQPVSGYTWPASGPRPGVFAPGFGPDTFPELSREVESHRVMVEATAYPAGTDVELAAKDPREGKVDLVDVRVILRWTDTRGRAQEQVLSTRVGRRHHELDPTFTTSGGP